MQTAWRNVFLLMNSTVDYIINISIISIIIIIVINNPNNFPMTIDINYM